MTKGKPESEIKFFRNTIEVNDSKDWNSVIAHGLNAFNIKHDFEDKKLMQVIQQDTSEIPLVDFISINATGATLCNTKIEHKDIKQPILAYSILTAEKKINGFAFSCSTEDSSLVITITSPNTATKIHATEIELVLSMPLGSVYNFDMTADFGALVYLGDGTKQSTFKIKSNSGNVKISNLNCDDLNVRLDLGAVKLVDYLAGSSISLYTNVGSIECDSKFGQGGGSKEVKLISDMGGIYGNVEGYRKMSCTTSGLVDIKLKPNPISTTDITSHLGSVTANVIDYCGKYEVSINFGLCNVTGKVNVLEKKNWMMGSSQKGTVGLEGTSTFKCNAQVGKNNVNFQNINKLL
ncbi:hypothetical protein HDV04_005296 [Boothiomyces sp. JEL0838]|nr:hypothetical protein HDV04_005296 [Boothiomyces sp. JEL0838]